MNIQKKRQPLVILISTGIIIVIYFIILCKMYGENVVYKDVLNKKVLTLPFINFDCSWWPVSHFLLYGILGYYYPEQYLLILSIGVLWEIIEYIAEIVVMKKKKRKPLREEDGSIQYCECWWQGGISDIIFNTIGFMFGYMLRKKIS